MIQRSFQSYLPSDTGIAAYVEDRIYGGRAPDEKKKGAFLVYSKAADYPTTASYCGPDVIQRCYFQFDSFSKSYDESILLSKAVKGALIGFTGMMGDTRVKLVTLEAEFEMLDVEPGLNRVSTTLQFWYVE